MSVQQHEPFQWWIIQQEVINQILPAFIANHPTYTPVLYDAWHSSVSHYIQHNSDLLRKNDHSQIFFEIGIFDMNRHRIYQELNYPRIIIITPYLINRFMLKFRPQ